ncbi:hypothetical protein EOPP23_19870 [Endozoicomonas sp. OPT23]|nr:hypothetical protein [Endozoicomonas sp. OPT23]
MKAYSHYLFSPVSLFLSLLLLVAPDLTAQTASGLSLDLNQFQLRQKDASSYLNADHSVLKGRDDPEHINSTRSGYIHADELDHGADDIKQFQQERFVIELAEDAFEWEVSDEDRLYLKMHRQSGCAELEVEASHCLVSDGIEFFADDAARLFSEAPDQIVPLGVDLIQDRVGQILAEMGWLIGRVLKEGVWVYLYTDGKGGVKTTTQDDYDELCARFAAEQIQSELEESDVPVIAPEDYQALKRGCGRLPSQPVSHTRNWMEMQGVNSLSSGVWFKPGKGGAKVLRRKKKGFGLLEAHTVPHYSGESTDPDLNDDGKVETASSHNSGESTDPDLSADREVETAQSRYAGMGSHGSSSQKTAETPYREVLKKYIFDHQMEKISSLLVTNIPREQQPLFIIALGGGLQDLGAGLSSFLRSHTTDSDEPLSIGTLVNALYALEQQSLLKASLMNDLVTGSGFLNNLDNYKKGLWGVDLKLAAFHTPGALSESYVKAHLVHMLLKRFNQKHVENKYIEDIFATVFGSELSKLLGTSPRGVVGSGVVLSSHLKLALQAIGWFEERASERSGGGSADEYHYGVYGGQFLEQIDAFISNVQTLLDVFNKPVSEWEDGRLAHMLGWLSHAANFDGLAAFYFILAPADYEEVSYPVAIPQGRDRVVDIPKGITVGQLYSAFYAVTPDTILADELAGLHEDFSVISKLVFKKKLLGDTRKILEESVVMGPGKQFFSAKSLVYQAMSSGGKYSEKLPAEKVREEYRKMSSLAFSEEWHEQLTKLRKRFQFELPEKRNAVMLKADHGGAIYVKMPFDKCQEFYEGNLTPDGHYRFCSFPDCSMKEFPEFMYHGMHNKLRYCPQHPPYWVQPLIGKNKYKVESPSGMSTVSSGHEHKLRDINPTDFEVESSSRGLKVNLPKSCGTCTKPITSEHEHAFVCETCFEGAKLAGEGAGVHMDCKDCQTEHCLKTHRSGGEWQWVKLGELIERNPDYLGGSVCDCCNKLLSSSFSETQRSSSDWSKERPKTKNALNNAIVHCTECKLDYCAKCTEELNKKRK